MTAVKKYDFILCEFYCKMQRLVKYKYKYKFKIISFICLKSFPTRSETITFKLKISDMLSQESGYFFQESKSLNWIKLFLAKEPWREIYTECFRSDNTWSWVEAYFDLFDVNFIFLLLYQLSLFRKCSLPPLFLLSLTSISTTFSAPKIDLNKRGAKKF